MSPNPDFLDSVKAVFQDTAETIVVVSWVQRR